MGILFGIGFKENFRGKRACRQPLFWNRFLFVYL